jgi:hypothetical protein
VLQVGLVDENVLEECLLMEANTQQLIDNGQWSVFYQDVHSRDWK